MRGSRGKLRIGDEWNAIVLLARPQTSPLKAVAELLNFPGVAPETALERMEECL